MNTKLREKDIETDFDLWCCYYGHVSYHQECQTCRFNRKIKQETRQKVLQEVFEKIAEIEEKYKFQYDSEGCESCVLALQQLKQSIARNNDFVDVPMK